jgi:hypothetical protein
MISWGESGTDVSVACTWPDASHPLRLLGARRERPRGCQAAEQRDELAPLHSFNHLVGNGR